MANDNGSVDRTMRNVVESLEADKNLHNVVAELAENPVNAHQAQQQNQQHNDRRHQDALNHEEPANNKSLKHHE